MLTENENENEKGTLNWLIFGFGMNEKQCFELTYGAKHLSHHNIIITDIRTIRITGIVCAELIFTHKMLIGFVVN